MRKSIARLFWAAALTGNVPAAAADPAAAPKFERLLNRPGVVDNGLELQITDERFERSYFPNATPEQLTGALYFVSGAKELAYVPGEWNHYRIEMRGPKAKVWLNQRLVQDVDLDTLTKPAKRHGEGQELLEAAPGAKRPRRGHIGFQDLSESGDSMLFRNIQIAELN